MKKSLFGILSMLTILGTFGISACTTVKDTEQGAKSQEQTTTTSDNAFKDFVDNRPKEPTTSPPWVGGGSCFHGSRC